MWGRPGAGQNGATEQPSQPDPAVEAGTYAKDPGLLRKKAEEFWQKHQYKEAVAFLEPIVKTAPEAVDHYTKVLQLGYAEFWVK